LLFIFFCICGALANAVRRLLDRSPAFGRYTLVAIRIMVWVPVIAIPASGLIMLHHGAASAARAMAWALEITFLWPVGLIFAACFAGICLEGGIALGRYVWAWLRSGY
jgi:hypothetical protein